MRTRLRVKPSKASSALGFFVGFIFIGLGAFVVIPVFGPFGIIWTLVAVGITVYHGFNLFSDKGAADNIIDIDSSITASNSSLHTTKEPAEARLQKLQQLKNQGLVSQAEYESQRLRILNEL